MEKVYGKCYGVDIHKKLIVACFKQGRKQENREFGASTRELLEMAQWLEEGGCEQVAMESTASYWKPLYNSFGMYGGHEQYLPLSRLSYRYGGGYIFLFDRVRWTFPVLPHDLVVGFRGAQVHQSTDISARLSTRQ